MVNWNNQYNISIVKAANDIVKEFLDYKQKYLVSSTKPTDLDRLSVYASM